MKSTIRHLRRGRIALITCVFTLWSLPASGQGLTPFSFGIGPTQLGPYSNFIQLSLGAPSVDGSVAQYTQRHRVPDAVFGGLEDLHIEQFVGERGLLTLDGRAIPANDEYRFKLDYSVTDVGYARANIDNFKVRYSGAGGYFLPLDKQFVPGDLQLAMDRGDSWIEGGLRMPSLPEITLRYTRRYRDGTKPSLSWGDTQDLGDFGTRNLVPSFWSSDEVRNQFDADLTERFGKTVLRVGARLESGDIQNSLNIWRRPGEPQERFLTDTETVEPDAFQVNAGATTELRPDLALSATYRFENLDNAFGGSRVYGADFDVGFDPEFPNRQRRDHGFLDIDGTTSRTLHTGSANLRFNRGDFTVVPTVRVDRMEVDGNIDVTDTNVEGDGSVTLTPLTNTNDRSATDLSGSLEARFRGIPNMVLYARADWLNRDGDIFERELETETGVVEFNRRAEDSKTTQRYLLGTNWHPTRQLRIGLQGYHRSRSIDYDHLENADGPLTYPGFLQAQDFETDDANVQVRWRPDRRVTLTGRFDVRRTVTEGTAENLGTYESSEINGRVFTASLSVSPVAQTYVQGYVVTSRNRILTPINELGDSVEDIVLEARNDYVSATVSAGAAVSARAALAGRFFYLEADNFVDNSSVGLPFDLSARELGFAAEGSYEFRPNLQGTLSFHHFLNREDTFGGSQDYDLTLVYGGLTFRF